MENIRKEIFDVEYKIVTPVHIGNGIQLPKTEFGAIKTKNVLRKIDFDNFIESIPSDKIGQISKDLRTAENEFLNQILHMSENDLEQIAKEYDLLCYFNYHYEDIKKIREITAHIKNPFSKPYIPGSSIKGWIRTAILSYYLRKIKDTNIFFDDFNKKLPSLPKGGRKLYYEKRDMGDIFEKRIFGGDPREDIFRFISVPDTTPIDPDQLRLGFIQIFHPTEQRGNYKFDSLQFSQYLEVLKKNTTLKSKIIFSQELDDFKKEYLQSDNFSTKLRKYIIENLIELPRKELIKEITTINNNLSKNIMEYNYKYLTTLNREIGSQELDSLVDYYENELFPFYDEIIEKNNQFLLRLGASTEWHSKTVGLEIMRYLLREKHVDFNNFYDGMNQLKLFKGQKMHKHFELTPISRSYLVDENLRPSQPLGWVKAEIKS
ncbi:MAG: hypothetical protein BAJALOKI3v1_820003 [Promethearchaeota archaeon]|nr:MAG: hypothetical protein BAJALOKI3v1_820003 [Candidatus Lokiarchaeota archaeon]